MIGQIRFDITEMTKIKDQLDTIKTNLTTSMNAIQTNLTTLSGNIKGDLVNSTITKYTTNNENVLDSTIKNIEALDLYLAEQIASYKATEEQEAESMTDVNAMIEGIVV